LLTNIYAAFEKLKSSAAKRVPVWERQAEFKRKKVQERLEAVTRATQAVMG
jgi:hypothetical protein